MERVNIDERRVARLAAVLREVPPSAIDASEAADPQFMAIKGIVSRHDAAAVAIVVANALVSYRIPKHGEDYWMDYSRFWVDKPTPRSGEELVSRVAEFLETERVAVIQQKIARLKRAKPLLDDMLRNPLGYTDLVKLYNDLVRVLRGPRYQKTVAFAAKMAYYAYKAMGVEVRGLEDIPVPLDKRFALLTATAWLIHAHPDVIYTRLREKAEEAWRLVARRSGIPPARLDTLLWLPARGVEPLVMKGLIGHARDEYTHRLLYYTAGHLDVKKARRIAEEVLYTIEWL